MKKTVFLMLCALMCISFMATSCDKKDEKPEKEPWEEACPGGDPESDILPYSVVVKFDGKYDYWKYVTVTYDKVNEKVKYYHSPEYKVDLKELTNGYYYATCDYFAEEAYTDITYEEYKDMSDKGIISEETLKNRIISTNYLTEKYFILDENAFKKDGKIDIDALNASIESGEFFTYEGVERVK
ncbi:MAG: hypothetical protein IKO90_01750 [Bacteroidales bacterium]|nr:hypothetical protein [Bacteroidales bacterium]MBR7036163.1 hypothetical protein [Bacteroidales bacterium]